MTQMPNEFGFWQKQPVIPKR